MYDEKTRKALRETLEAVQSSPRCPECFHPAVVHDGGDDGYGAHCSVVECGCASYYCGFTAYGTLHMDYWSMRGKPRQPSLPSFHDARKNP